MLAITTLYQPTNKIVGQAADACFNYIFRLKQLEPEQPIDIKSKPIANIPLPSKVFSISDVIKKGNDVKIDFVYNDPNWNRPAYKSYWHSTVSGGRWSYVPNRINYSLHDIFTIYATASIYYDFAHNLGIWDESESFNWDGSKTLENIMLVTMNSNIKKIVTYGNQVVVIVEPARRGLQVFAIPNDVLKPVDKKSSIMFQLVTPDKYELDYSLIFMNDRHKE